LVRLPRRSLDWIGRSLDPDYALERSAKSLVRRLGSETLTELRAIPGRCLERECCLVAHLALMSPAGVVVEIGAFKGRMTAWLVEAAQLRLDRPTVHSIDPHVLGSWNDFCATATKLRLIERGLVVHHDTANNVARTWSAPISLLWIDGSHDYDDVRNDIANFVPYVVKGNYSPLCGGVTRV
jgi:predicted O-methyltransferase YrrM